MLESLETRQLLSVASVDLTQIVAQPSVGANPTALLSSLYPSSLWFGSEPEVAALIDIVEPFQAPVPADAPNKAATRSRTEATVMLPSMGLPFLPRLDHGEEGADRLGADLSCPSPAAPLLPEVSREDESPTASPAPRLAFAAALAGAGYWITLRDFKGRKPGWGVPRSDRALRPRVRRWSLVPR